MSQSESELATTRISTRGQVVIPQSIRESLGLESSDEIVVVRDGDRIIMRKLHLGDILKETEMARKQHKTISHKEMKKRYGL